MNVLGPSKSAASQVCSKRGFRQISLPAESCDTTDNEAEKRVVLSESASKPKRDQTKGTVVKGDPAGRKQGRRYILFVGLWPAPHALPIC